MFYPAFGVVPGTCLCWLTCMVWEDRGVQINICTACNTKTWNFLQRSWLLNMYKKVNFITFGLNLYNTSTKNKLSEQCAPFPPREPTQSDIKEENLPLIIINIAWTDYEVYITTHSKTYSKIELYFGFSLLGTPFFRVPAAGFEDPSFLNAFLSTECAWLMTHSKWRCHSRSCSCNKRYPCHLLLHNPRELMISVTSFSGS